MARATDDLYSPPNNIPQFTKDLEWFDALRIRGDWHKSDEAVLNRLLDHLRWLLHYSIDNRDKPIDSTIHAPQYHPHHPRRGGVLRPDRDPLPEFPDEVASPLDAFISQSTTKSLEFTERLRSLRSGPTRSTRSQEDPERSEPRPSAS